MTSGSSSSASPFNYAHISIERQVEWVDTDASGHWHNTAVIRFAEMAESALFNALGLTAMVYSHGAPRVRTEAVYKGSANFGDLIDISCSVVEVGKSKIVLDSSISLDNAEIATISITAVLVGADRRPRSWPDEAREAMLNSGRLVEGR